MTSSSQKSTVETLPWSAMFDAYQIFTSKPKCGRSSVALAKASEATNDCLAQPAMQVVASGPVVKTVAAPVPVIVRPFYRNAATNEFGKYGDTFAAGQRICKCPNCKQVILASAMICEFCEDDLGKYQGVSSAKVVKNLSMIVVTSMMFMNSSGIATRLADGMRIIALNPVVAEVVARV